MNKETTYMRLREDTLSKIRKYSELEDRNQNELINDLLDTALDQYHLVKVGGMVLTVPNPQFNCTTPEEAKYCVLELSNIAKNLIGSGIHTGLFSMADFFETRLISDTEEDRARFSRNLEELSVQSE